MPRFPHLCIAFTLLKGCVFMNSELQTLIASVGFPIALSMYLLVRIEGKLQTLSDSINELSKNIIGMKWLILKKGVINHDTFFIIINFVIFSFL